ncbi:MAG TPA: hypothetical protein VM686_20690 [Polyangiaceae bacterium]|nr:hypothetical protein [Polyangiaceae bacterium]
MQLRWFHLLSGLAIALGSAACSGGNDDDSDSAGRGGSAGSNAGSGGASGESSQAGSTSSPPARVGLQLSLHPPNTPIPNTECFPAGTSSIGNPPPTLNPLSPGERVSDGDEDLSVVCSVTGPDTFDISATIAQGDLRFKVSDGTIDAAAGTGTFELLIETVEAGDIVTELDQLCTFDVSEPPLEVSAGNLFATFECPVLWNHATATDTACGADGALVLEFCMD